MASQQEWSGSGSQVVCLDESTTPSKRSEDVTKDSQKSDNKEQTEEEHCRILKENEKWIKQKIILENAFVDMLLQKKIIESEESHDVKRKLRHTGEDEAVSVLFTCMMKKDRQKVFLFIKALRENGQDRVADRLQNSFGSLMPEDEPSGSTKEDSVEQKPEKQEKSGDEESQPKKGASPANPKNPADQLCDACRMRVAKRTMGEQDVLPVLGQIGTNFCTFMSHNVFTQYRIQTITRAKNDGEALGYIREAFSNSLAPDMVDELLRVLRLEQIGMEVHAKEIEKVYHRKIDEHERCEKCRPAP